MDASSSGPLEDRFAIHERAAAYAEAVIRHDVDAWDANWTEDAVWAFRGQELVGSASRRQCFLASIAPYTFIGFFCSVASVTVEGESARSRAYTHELVVREAGGSGTNFGAYEDELVRRNGIWLYARRTFTPLHRA